MAEHADVVVIGAGLGGLAAGVTAAGQGRHVVVLEHHTLPGGYAQCFQRGPYRFDASLHALNGLAPGGAADTLYRDLGIWDRLRLRRLDPLYVARFPDHEVVAHADPFRYEAGLIRQFPDEMAGLRSYLDEAWAVYRDSRRLGTDGAAGRSPSPEEFLARYRREIDVPFACLTHSRYVDDEVARWLKEAGCAWEQEQETDSAGKFS